jgi:hypothetical protein
LILHVALINQFNAQKEMMTISANKSLTDGQVKIDLGIYSVEGEDKYVYQWSFKSYVIYSCLFLGTDNVTNGIRPTYTPQSIVLVFILLVIMLVINMRHTSMGFPRCSM